MKYIYTLIFLILSFVALTQGLDSSLFISDFEYAVFEQQLTTHDANPIDLFVCLDGSKEDAKKIHNQINDLEKELELKGVTKRSEKSKIKYIYKIVHSEMFSKYNEDIYFSDIFSTGRYNCVTASALYAAVLDYFDVPYQIKEKPNHVYLIADPDNTQILLESTNPSNGIVVYDARQKKQYVDYLVSNKIISKMEAATSSVDDIFDAFHSQDVDINLIELAGIQYYNRGISAYKSEDFKAATIFLQKAHMLYSSTNINFLLQSSFKSLFHKQYVNGDFSGNDLARFTNLTSENGGSKSVSVDVYDLAMEELLINKADYNKFKQFNSSFYSALNDTINTSSFDEVYYPRMGFYEYSQDNYSAALEYFNMAYLHDTNNIRMKMSVQELVRLSVVNETVYSAMVDSLDYYFDVYPFLAEKEQFQRLYLYANIRAIGTAFEDEDMQTVEYYVSNVEPFLVNIDPLIYTESMEQLYNALASEYLFAGNEKKSIDYINRGLALMPNSELLLRRKKEILQYNSYLRNRKEYVPIASKLAPEDFSEKFNDNFPNCWEVTKVRKNGYEENYQSENAFTINASKYSKVTVGKDNTSKYGRWAIRSKSKLLYLIPENDKENYLMFKVVDIKENRMELRLYEGKTCSKDVLIFTKCK